MIVIRVQTRVKPEMRSEFLQQAQKDVAQSREFEGCVQIHWSENIEDPNVFTLYEEWETPAAFDAFKSSEAFKRNGEVMFPMFAEAPNLAYYNASAM